MSDQAGRTEYANVEDVGSAEVHYDLREVEASGIELVGYHDLANRPGLKLAIARAKDRWYLFAGSLWQPGFSVLDVTDPSPTSTEPAHDNQRRNYDPNQ